MKTVAIFTGYYLPHLGGVERYVDKMAKGLLARGYKVVIVTSNHADLPVYEQLNGINVYRLPIFALFQSRYPLFRLNRMYRQTINHIENESIDFVILNTRFHLTSLIGARLSRRLGIPNLLIEHGTSHFSVGVGVLDLFGRSYEHVLTSILKRSVENYYGVSENCSKWLAHFRIKARGVLYNAIEPEDSRIANDEYFRIFDDTQVVVSYAGRLIKEKGVVNLLKAFQIIKSRNPDVNLRLAIAGSGPLEATLRATDDKSVTMLGRLDFSQVMSLYKRTDIFVYPSLYPEGLPTSILEAALMSCAIIATPKGGTEEVIPDKSHGIIVDGSVESLVDSLQELLSNPGRRGACGNTVEKRVKSVFNWDSVVERIDVEMGLIRK